MNGKNRRVQQSITLINDAFLALLEIKPFAEISISEICRTATVSRNTFYRWFSSKEDVLGGILEEKTGNILQQYLILEDYDLVNPSEEDVVRTYDRFYRFWFDQRKLLEILRSQSLLWMLDRAFLKTVPVYGGKSFQKLTVPLDPDFFMDYFFFWQGMSMSKIIQKWVLRGFRESVEDLVAVTIRLHQTMNYKWN